MTSSERTHLTIRQSWLILAFDIILGIVPAAVLFYADTQQSGLRTAYIGFLVICSVLFGLLIRHNLRKGYVQVTNKGVNIHTLFRSFRYSWEEIERFVRKK